MDHKERSARIKSLSQGPWIFEGRITKALLKPKSVPRFAPSTILSINDFYRYIDSNLRKRDTTTWAEYFMPHWETIDGVIEGDKINQLRQSLDEALTFLQLLELAVQTGYLDVRDIRTLARRELVNLLWSKSIRRFVIEYDYFLVLFLAKRVQVDLGLPCVAPPPISSKGQIKFALFLDQLRRTYDDQFFIDWLDFLDGYDLAERVYASFEDDTDEDDYEPDVRRFLRNIQNGRRSLTPTIYLSDSQRIAIGLHNFVLLMGDFFDALDSEEMEQYGLFYSYWLAKFHGFSLESVGTRSRKRDESKTTDLYWRKRRYRQTETDWSKVIERSPQLFASSGIGVARKSAKSSMQIRLVALRRAWDLTLNCIRRSTNAK